MVNVLLVLAGVGLWSVVMADFVATTIGARGPGPIARRIGGGLWSAARAALSRHDSLRGRAVVGPVILTVIGLFWIFATWGAWMLMFAGTNSLEISLSNEPADLIGLFVYTGSSLSTAGSTTISVANMTGEALTVLAAVNGMVVLTLTVSFILNLIQTIQSGRAFALRVGAAETMEELDTPSTMTALTEVCTELNVNPLALYFVPPRADLSIADAIAHLVRMVRDDDGDCAPFERRIVAKAIAVLPYTGTEVGDVPDERALDRWRDRYGTERGRTDALGSGPRGDAAGALR